MRLVAVTQVSAGGRLGHLALGGTLPFGTPQVGVLGSPCASPGSRQGSLALELPVEGGPCRFRAAVRCPARSVFG
jgi:hypothetical protein